VGKVYISNETGGRSEYPELEARELLRQGLISRRARYWKAGMTEPRPVSELLKDASPDETETADESPGFIEGMVSKIREWWQKIRRGGGGE
jgi:hypothetical protein